jgi:RimJ/RimL family protein N-acetyltransferase
LDFEVLNVIRGERVILRAVEPSDVRQLWEWRNDEEGMRLRDWPEPPYPLAQAEKDYEESQCDEHHLRFVITTLDGELIGETALTHIDQRSGEADFNIAIGNKAYWGKGYGTDATHALMKYGFEQMNLHRVTLYVHDFNARAIRVYEKCGFQVEGRMRKAHYMDGQHTDVLVMGLLREDFEALEPLV